MFAVVIAITIVGSAIGVAQIVRPDIVEPFTALGLLNPELKIGDYPKHIYPGQNITLGIFIYNHRPYPILAQIRYKIGTNNTIPTSTAPSPEPTIKVFEFLVGVKENITQRIVVSIPMSIPISGKAALIFELWVYDIDRNEWVYTGIWNHLYVEVIEVPIP